MKIILKYIKPYWWIILCAVVLLFGQATCDLALPDYMSDIVNNGITTGDTAYIIQVGLKMLAIAFLSAGCTVTVGFLGARTAAGVSRSLRQDVFEKVEDYSNAEFDKFSTSSLITRTTNDITQIQMLIVMMIRMVFYAPIMGVGGFIHALAKSKSMSWIIGVAVVMLLGLVMTLLVLVMPKFQAIQKLIDKLNMVVRENLDGMLVIRAFNTQKFEEKRFDNVNSELTATNLFVNRRMSAMMPMMTLIMNLVTVLVVWVGAKQVSAFKMEVGDMMAYMQYVMQIIMAFLMMSMMFIMIPRAIVSIKRIVEVLETDATIVTPKAPSEVPGDIKGVIEYRDVSFSYPNADEAVLTDISFTARPGQTTAFIGSTGSGKSTLVNLLPRFYDVSSGEILIDGINIKDWPLEDLRQALGFVPQKGILFSGTIDSNLSYGKRDASRDEIIKAAGIAQAMEFIESKPDLFETPIAQGGGNVSGGQKQRLSIARALVRNAPIYIFDDSFSALDFKTDAKLRAALKQETGGSTVLLVAQRISTIMNAEQIVVLDHGKICGVGTHRELMQNCSIYREIALSQLSEEELL